MIGVSELEAWGSNSELRYSQPSAEFLELLLIAQENFKNVCCGIYAPEGDEPVQAPDGEEPIPVQDTL